ncbi:MAG: tetratricopeptide repeat protein [Trichlorobacter sp.]|jgi:TolA-binding protein|nr:tetratricopeptide repeat protein [Trichlorobacter sp.]
MKEPGLHFILRTLLHLCCIFFIAFFFLPTTAIADTYPANRLLRINAVNNNQLGKIKLTFEQEPHYTLTRLSDGRVMLRLHNTKTAPPDKKQSTFTNNISKLVLRQAGDDTLLTITFASQAIGWRVVHVGDIAALSIEAGTALGLQGAKTAVLPGRERIRAGAEQLLRDFDPPLKTEIPFAPTDRLVLATLLDEEDQKLFMSAESFLYKGQLTNAEALFQRFVERQDQIRPLALYRLAETQYRLQKYSQALATFREAVKLWEDFFRLNPVAMFYYGDSIARNGDMPGGRQLLAQLITDHADKKYAPILLVRMADVLARQGYEAEALSIYSTVDEEFHEGKARQIARLKLADRKLLQATPDNYRHLAQTYARLADTAADFDLREEASFKQTLLEAINGPADVALELVRRYQKRYPGGAFTAITKDMREDLLLQVYRNQTWQDRPSDLISLVSDNQDFLRLLVDEPGFLQAVTDAYAKAGRPLDLIALYSSILQRAWPGGDAQAYLSLEIAIQSDLLGDEQMSRKTLENFLRKNPDHPMSAQARELLGAIFFRNKNLPGVANQLSWLLNKDAKATNPDSYYYLGRALWEQKKYNQTALAMETYIASVKTEKDQPAVLGDAFYVAASAEQESKNLERAKDLLVKGMEKTGAGYKDQFLYKLGELALQENKTAEARSFFETVAKSGTDPDWRKMAAQRLAEL